jgi:hypothetical protein
LQKEEISGIRHSSPLVYAIPDLYSTIQEKKGEYLWPGSLY